MQPHLYFPSPMTSELEETLERYYGSIIRCSHVHVYNNACVQRSRFNQTIFFENFGDCRDGGGGGAAHKLYAHYCNKVQATTLEHPSENRISLENCNPLPAICIISPICRLPTHILGNTCERPCSPAWTVWRQHISHTTNCCLGECNIGKKKKVFNHVHHSSMKTSRYLTSYRPYLLTVPY